MVIDAEKEERDSNGRGSVCLLNRLNVCLCRIYVFVCPQRCHFRNVFHILCRHQPEFTAVAECLFSSPSP